ncbi:MAG: zinc ribbon domain-containing protein [Candidatus Heimdallarchaeota archaeon]|nr:zinc ribbon domain-containing protein [Candidatus Heimdallarchaeota archaeon]
MEKQYCVSCGAEITKDGSFCIFCGAKIEQRKLHSEPLKSSYSEEVQGESIVYNRSKENEMKIKPKRKGLIAIPIILALVIIPIITLTTISSIKIDLGTLNYDVPITAGMTVNLNVNNDIGSITIFYDETLTNLFESEIIVRGGLKASINDAVNFNHEIVENITIITFNFQNLPSSFFNMKSISHEIEIYINPHAIVDFNIETATGSIDCYAENIDNVIINNLALTSSTGSIDFIAENMINLTMGEVILKTSTGSIGFDLGGSTNTSLTALELGTSTGSIDVDLGTHTNFNGSIINIYTSTGSIEIEYSNIRYSNDIYWEISTSTGSIYLTFEQTVIFVDNITVDFTLETSTGSIEVDCTITTAIGIEMDAGTSTGSIDLPNGHDYYISPDFALKSNQYSFYMRTSTGSITGNVQY